MIKKILTTLALLMLLLSISQQSMAKTIELPDMGASSNLALTPQMEDQIAHSVVAQLKNSHQLVEDLELNAYLESLGLHLIESGQKNYQSYRFFLQGSPEINAFASPGGIVTVYSGLFLATETESELASVLAHEIAHVTQKHLARAIEKSKQMDIPMTLGMIAGVLLGAVASSPDIGVASVSGLSALGVQNQINFTRENEIEADSVGIETLAKANYDPYGMSRFFQKLQNQNRYMTGNYPEFLLTHPVTINRIAVSSQKADNFVKKNSMLKQDNTVYSLMKAKLDIITSMDKQQTHQKYQLLSGQNTIKQRADYWYGYGLSFFHDGKIKQALSILRKLYQTDNTNSYYITAYCEALLNSDNSKNQQQAMQILAQSLKKHPFHKIITALYSEALIQSGQAQQSIKLIEKYFQYASVDAIFYKQLAYAYQQTNQPILSRIAQADFFYNNAQYQQALNVLQMARNEAKDNFYQLSQIEAKISINKQKLIWLKEEP